MVIDGLPRAYRGFIYLRVMYGGLIRTCTQRLRGLRHWIIGVWRYGTNKEEPHGTEVSNWVLSRHPRPPFFAPLTKFRELSNTICVSGPL